MQIDIMIESIDNLTNELVYPNELHNDENMKKKKYNINKLFIQILHEQWIQLLKRFFKKQQVSNIKIIKIKNKDSNEQMSCIQHYI